MNKTVEAVIQIFLGLAIALGLHYLLRDNPVRLVSNGIPVLMAVAVIFILELFFSRSKATK